MTTATAPMTYDDHIQAVAHAARERGEAQATYDDATARLYDAEHALDAARAALKDYDTKQITLALEQE